MIVLISGGQRSGKSKFGENILIKETDVGYIATSKIYDEEMAHRVSLHKDQRPSTWTTYEIYRDIPKGVKSHKYYILECMGNMLSNILYDYTKDFDYEEIEQELVHTIENYFLEQLKSLVEYVKSQESNLYIITNEVGMSLTPVDKLGRIFTDILGRGNQYIGNLSDEVYLIVAGQGLRIK